MTLKLREIASIHTGVFAKPVVTGEIVYIQAKHFDGNGNLISTLHPDLNQEVISENHLLKHGDILFAAKGTKNFAAYYESKNQPAVASTSFFVIRIQENFQDKIIPEYLRWYLNNPNSQKFLKGRAIGSSMVSISKSVLKELGITIPDLQIQKTILNITHLRNKEKFLDNKIETLKEMQIQQQIINAIK